MTVSVIVPWRPDGGHRDAAWAWCRRQWQTHHPAWELIEGRAPDGEWCKAAAVADGLAQAHGELLVIADADVWTAEVGAAVDRVAAGAPWAVPHLQVRRLDEASTARVLAGGPLSGTLARPTYLGRAGGGMTVIGRDTITAVQMDPRYKGWGQEDDSWALALSAVVGAPWRGRAPLWHLWHPPQARLTEVIGSRESQALYRRYQRAARTKREMQRLLAEIQ